MSEPLRWLCSYHIACHLSVELRGEGIAMRTNVTSVAHPTKPSYNFKTQFVKADVIGIRFVLRLFGVKN